MPVPELLSYSKTPSRQTIYWRNHYDTFRNSELSRADYCRVNGLSYDNCAYWFRKFEFERPSKPLPETGFSSVTLSAPPFSSSNETLCTLELGFERRLLIHDVSVLKTLLEVCG